MKKEPFRITRASALARLRRYLLIIPPSILYAIGFNLFYVPNGIAYGGVTGIAQAVNALFGFPGVGTGVILLNIPLFILAWRVFGVASVVDSFYTMLLGSILIDVCAALYTFPPMDMMLASIFGGVLIGLSLGMILRQGATTGGTTILARLLKHKFPYMSMGSMQLITDLVSITLVAVVLQTLYSALYGAISLYISTFMLDTVLYGVNKAKFAYIITHSPVEVAKAITETLPRGVTLLTGRGAYTGEARTVLLCAFKRTQIVQLKQLVKSFDPAAFIIVCDANEVLGEGFSQYKEDEM